MHVPVSHVRADRGGKAVTSAHPVNACYALGAPLSIDWGSMYSPQVPGAVFETITDTCAQNSAR